MWIRSRRTLPLFLKVPLLFDTLQLTLQCRHFFITSRSFARKGFLQIRIKLTAPSGQIGRIQVQITGNLSNGRSRIPDQLDRFLLVLLRVCLSRTHGVPPPNKIGLFGSVHQVGVEPGSR